jgi:general secretion pathway protein G
MIELVFVIVILGVLAAIAIPKFASTTLDAQISKGKADVSSIRSAIISERQSRLIQGDANWISALSSSSTKLFDGNGSSTILMYGITPSTSSGSWSGSDPDYTYKIGNDNCGFHYDNSTGKFDLNSSQPTSCNDLVN